MANETELSNIAHVTNVISAAITPALVQGPVVAPLIRYEPIPVGTAVRLFRCDGYLIAEEISESTAHAVDAAGQELTQTTVTATCVKLCANVMATVESQQFGGLTLADCARYIGEALARDWDGEIKELSDSPTNAVTATSTLTWADVLEAAYNVRAGTYDVASGPLVGVFDIKGMFELQKEQWNSSASVYTLPQTAQLLTGYELGKKGFRGEKGGIYLYETTGLDTSSSDDCGIVFDPNLYWGGMVSDRPQVRTRWIGGTDGTRGYADEVAGWIFCDIIEWNDAAGCEVKSDT